MNYHEEQIRKSMGERTHKPYVSFFDHAVPNQTMTEESGRPRFIEKVYIQKIPSAPDLATRDIFTRAKVAEDEQEFPEEWALYLSRKESIDNLRPPITAIPGMTVAAKAELLALGIRDCEAFVDYDQPLDDLEPLRETAQRIMEVSRDLREGRQTVRVKADRPMHDPAGIHWLRREAPEEKATSQEKDGQTFSYEIPLSM